MATFLLKRLVSVLALMWILTVVIFVLISVSTQGLESLFPVRGETPFEIARERSYYGMDESPAQQYFVWLGQILQGNFGTVGGSREAGFPITTFLGPKLMVSLTLILSSLSLSLVLGFGIGTFSALKPNHVLTRFFHGFAMLGVSVPDFAIGILMLVVFAVQLQWLPAFGVQGILVDPSWWEIILDRLRYLIMPSITLAFAYIATFSEYIRLSLINVLGEDYIRTARSKGVGEYGIVVKHALRNSMIPILASVVSSLPFFLGGIVVVERLFSWPGIGLYLYQTVFDSFTQDFYVALIIIGVAAFFSLMMSLLADFLYALVDPRIRSPLAHRQKGFSPIPFLMLFVLGLIAVFLYQWRFFSVYENVDHWIWIGFLFLASLFLLVLPVQRGYSRALPVSKKNGHWTPLPLTGLRSPLRAWKDMVKRMTNGQVILGSLLLGIIILASLYPGYIGIEGVGDIPNRIVNRLQPPSLQFPMGTTGMGQEMLLLVLVLAQDTLQIVFWATALAVAGGAVLGILMGFFKGPLDTLIRSLFDLISAVPNYFLVFLVLGIASPGTGTIVMVVSVFGMIDIARVIRAQVLAIREYQFIEAARAVGNTDLQIMINHLLINIIPLIGGQGIVLFGKHMLLISSLGYLDILPFETWGSLSGTAVRRSLYSWWTSVFPILMICITVFSVNILGKGVLKAIDPFAQKK